MVNSSSKSKKLNSKVQGLNKFGLLERAQNKKASKTAEKLCFAKAAEKLCFASEKF